MPVHRRRDVVVRLGRAASGAVRAAPLLGLVWLGGARRAGAQAGPPPVWNDDRTLALVQLATDVRARQLADTGLRDYRAEAHGYLTFLAQLGTDPRSPDPFTEPPRIVKADELALRVFWRAPNLSRQQIVGRRDSLLLPTDIHYHQDHLGIVQNNFPSVIRLGEGDEVRDVPHPLSPEGLREYDFSIRDSLEIRFAGRAVKVFEVRVRPKDDRRPGVIGAVYVDRDEGQVVRMAFNFTRAAFLDKELEDISIVLENGLIGGRFWLPRRQEVEIRRTGSWLEFPARGIIRGRWEVCCYEVNAGLPAAMFAGPEIVVAPPSVRRAHVWQGRILDSLPPDVRAVTDADVRAVQQEARELVRAHALARSRSLTLSARGVSDFVRVNRVEGLAAGGGATRRLGAGISVAVAGRYGFDDREAKGQGTIAWQRPSGVGVEGVAYRAYRDAGDVQERSLAVNSIAAQEFGSDYTDPYDVRGAGAAVNLPTWRGVRWRAQAVRETQAPLALHARPAWGSYEPTLPAWHARETRLSLLAERPTALSALGTEMRASAEVRAGLFERRDSVLTAAHAYFGRAFLDATVERPFGRHRLILRTVAGAVDGVPAVPPQEYVMFGGPISGPGYEFHELAGEVNAAQRVEWRTPISFVSIPLGRFGSTGRVATLAPFLHAVYLRHPAPFSARRDGWYPTVGLGGLFVFDVLRMDVARGLRDGRWTFSLDVGRELWGVL